MYQTGTKLALRRSR